MNNKRDCNLRSAICETRFGLKLKPQRCRDQPRLASFIRIFYLLRESFNFNRLRKYRVYLVARLNLIYMNMARVSTNSLALGETERCQVSWPTIFIACDAPDGHVENFNDAFFFFFRKCIELNTAYH